MSDDETGNCCATMSAVIGSDEFNPAIYVDDGVLFITVGFAPNEDGELGMYDHALKYCPFCGSRVQGDERIKERGGAATIQ